MNGHCLSGFVAGHVLWPCKRWLATLLAGAVVVMPARASIDKAEDYTRASAELRQVVTERAANGVDLTAEQIEPLIRDMTDLRILASAREGKDALRSIAQVCEAAHEATRALTNFRLDPARPDLPRMQANMLRYQSATLRLAEFLAHCHSMTVSQVVSFLEAQGKAPTSPRQAEGLAQIRQSVHFFLRAAFYMLGQASFDERLRFRLLDALGQTAAIYAASMIPEAKTGLRDLAETTLRTAPVHFRLNLRKFIDAMGGNTCNAICKA